MSSARHWEIMSLAALCVAATGLLGCSGETGESSTLPVESSEATSAGTTIVNVRSGERGEALFGGYRELAEIRARSPRISSGLPTPSPVLRPDEDSVRSVLAPPPSLELHALEAAPVVLAAPSPPPAATFRASGTSGTPPDTRSEEHTSELQSPAMISYAVGPNHAVTIINFRVIVQNRTGVTLSDVDLGEFFASVIPPGNSAFDPRAAYDPFANRWVLTCPTGVGFRDNSTVVLAVSQTNDPTGAWNFYSFPSDPEGLRWADHNGLGLNSKWIVIHANMVPLDGSGADFRQHFFALKDRKSTRLNSSHRL